MALDYLHAATHWFGRRPDQLGGLMQLIERTAIRENGRSQA
jgi:hypothetical protein